MNTLFTSSDFLGISLNPDSSLVTSSACSAGPDVAKRLVMFEVISFSFFLFSTLVVQGLKIHLNLINSKYKDEPVIAEVDKRVLNLRLIGSANWDHLWLRVSDGRYSSCD
ncbi:hypothetical protein CRG98_024330 [Punica granatum]|uniref:Uncharacterized protein n=1 Tax=Punica granatum TaxID=22663 RepID=A0A2I0JGE9_PUNGR|nr:hypothetical protein CRG98_024330 [Punica granatum]